MTARKELEDRELAKLYRESAREEPPAALDARILAAARATAAAPRVVVTSWASRWRYPAAMAVTVLLTATLTLLLRDDEANRLSDPYDGPGTARALQRAAKAASAAVSDVTPGAPSASGASVQGRPGDKAAPRRNEPAPQSDRGPVAVSGSVASRADESASNLSRSHQGVAREFSPEPRAVRGAPAADDVRLGSAKKDQAVAEKMQSGPEAPPSATDTAASAARSAGDGPAARSPAQWLADIRKLQQEGKTAEARASLVEFRKRHPQYRLPEDLNQP